MKNIENVPVVTLYQPWVFWIVLGWKTIETRLHNRFKNLKGKTIGLHVGKKWDKSAIEQAKYYLTDLQIEMSKMFLSIGGYIACTAFVYDFRELRIEDSKKALIDCNPKYVRRFGLFLKDIRILDGIYAKGHQGIWYFKNDRNKK